MFNVEREYERLRQIIAEITYKPGWTFELLPQGPPRELPAFIDFSQACLLITFTTSDVHFPGATIALTFNCSVRLEIMEERPEEWVVEQVIWNAISQLEEHERKEWLKWRGRCIKEPHPELATKLAASLYESKAQT